jgi:hypothetical protein
VHVWSDDSDASLVKIDDWRDGAKLTEVSTDRRDSTNDDGSDI